MLFDRKQTTMTQTFIIFHITTDYFRWEHYTWEFIITYDFCSTNQMNFLGKHFIWPDWHTCNVNWHWNLRLNFCLNVCFNSCVHFHHNWWLFDCCFFPCSCCCFFNFHQMKLQLTSCDEKSQRVFFPFWM